MGSLYTMACDWTEAQKDSVRSALATHLSNEIQAGQEVAKFADYELGISRIMSGEVKACICAGYVLVFGIDAYWYSRDPVLYELMLARIEPRARFDGLIGAMKQIATENHCVGILTGNGVQRPGLTRRYLAHGFRVINTNHYLELT